MSESASMDSLMAAPQLERQTLPRLIAGFAAPIFGGPRQQTA